MTSIKEIKYRGTPKAGDLIRFFPEKSDYGKISILY